ncbi:hypothetical protein QBC33DRAFT_108099 [Phialemonium atrogriseum]|uniref:Uncharacterized protein n=1 Tax=Phialemonium atrogriseum TaxID=1093897 RepID=A0AAJ0FMF9_9PEZI|nr:uncharacterized protein QBC33DRAFT_108099 [Phialemonium atrogriseum]KAK1766095.1 hypothetical protein QBC33DRAFT_108099 [Phialemonium atrogriseum]
MATMDDEREPNHPRYELESYVTSTHDDNTRFTIRRNGKVFHIRVSPSQFVNSPATTEKYLSYLEVLRSGEEVIGDIFDTDVFEWVTRPFEPLFAELAPSPALPGHHADIKVTLQNYLFPKFFIFALDVVEEKLQPRRIEIERSPYVPPSVWLDDEFLDDLEKWTALYDPARIVLSFENPEDALFKHPGKVLIDDGQTPHSVYNCRPRSSPGFYEKTMDKPARRRPHRATQGRRRLGGCQGRERAGRPRGQRVDTDFGGSYTRGWVESQVAGTVEGDLAGMAKLREFISLGMAGS